MIFPTDAISQNYFMAAFEQIDLNFTATSTLLSIYVATDENLLSSSYYLDCGADKSIYFLNNQQVFLFQKQAIGSGCTLKNYATSTATAYVVLTPYQFSTSTERFGFTPGETIISFFLFIILLGLFLKFIIDNFMGVKRKIK